MVSSREDADARAGVVVDERRWRAARGDEPARGRPRGRWWWRRSRIVRRVCPDAAVNMTEESATRTCEVGMAAGAPRGGARGGVRARGRGIGGVGDGNKDDPSLFLCRASIRECIRRGGDARTFKGEKRVA